MMGAQIWLDAMPAFQSLEKHQLNDPILSSMKLKIVLGRSLNPNKNPVGESTVGEVKRELLHLTDPNKPITQATLALAIRNLNSRVRASGKSAWEMLTSRDVLMGEATNIKDDDLIDDLKAPGGLVYEKVEGLAVTDDGVWVINDNEHVGDDEEDEDGVVVFDDDRDNSTSNHPSGS